MPLEIVDFPFNFCFSLFIYFSNNINISSLRNEVAFNYSLHIYQKLYFFNKHYTNKLPEIAEFN